MYRDNITKNYKQVSTDDARGLWEDEYRCNIVMLLLSATDILLNIVSYLQPHLQYMYTHQHEPRQ
jgi:hypothetical protein